MADAAGIARNTAQARLARLENGPALGPFEPAALGYPLTAFITALLTQRALDQVARPPAAVPEVLQVHGISGLVDLLIHVVARDADDLYRIAGQIRARPASSGPPPAW